MKKGLLNLLVVGLTLSMVGCGTPKQHVHKYDTENIEWFWKQLQNKDYEASATFYCKTCKEDVEGHSVTETATVNRETTTPATCLSQGLYTYTASVTFENTQYTATKTREYRDDTAHHFIQVKDPAYLKYAATCESNAVYYLVCEVCNEVSTETFEDEGSKLGHSLEHHDATSSTCQVHGNLEYYYCSRCEQYFLQEGGAAVEYSQIELPLSHNMTLHAGTPATCTEEGTLDYYTCEFEPGVRYLDAAGERRVESDSDLIEHALGHELSETGYCSKCGTSNREAFGLEEATPLDSIAPITISDLGFESGVTIPNGIQHLYADYDFKANKGIDLWYKPKYVVHTYDAYNYFYLFNEQGKESGISFRFNTQRIEDDGIVGLYIYTMEEYGGATTVNKGPAYPSDFYYFPRSSGIKSTTNNVFRMSAYCLNEGTNLYRCIFTGGIEGGIQYYPAKNPEDDTNTPLYFDIELGANYFDIPRKVRFSSTTGDSKLYDAESQEKMVVYKYEDGTAFGKKTGTTINTFNHHKENKQFVGWFDNKGHKVTDGQAVTSKTIVQPLFIEKQENMLVPSDIGMGNKGEWYDVNSTTVTGEVPSERGFTPTGNRVDMYLIYESTAFLGSDNWSKFGFPYDFIDEHSRLFIRFNENNNGSLDGFISGGSLGIEGATGTHFSLGSSFRRKGDQLLVHLTVIDNGSNNITFTLEVTNLRTRQTADVSYNVTFDHYSMSEGATRNKMALLPAVNCEWRFMDAF